MENNSEIHVKSLARGLQILNLLAEKKRSMSLTEISTALKWPKSTVHGLLSTLRCFDYVAQSELDGKYYLGIRLFELGNILQASWDIHSIARPVMVKLNARFGETVHLATEDKGEVLYLEKLDSSQLLRIVSQVGARLPMYCTGVGKTLLAFKPPERLQRYFQQSVFSPYTAKTITDKTALARELQQIRERGYAYDNGEIMDSLRCVSAPIYDINGEVKYALSVSGLNNTMTKERVESITQAILSACRNISKEIGYTG